MKHQRGYTIVKLIYVVWFGVVLLAIGGWVANIVKLIGMDFGAITGMLIARAAGIFVAPLGAVLGFF